MARETNRLTRQELFDQVWAEPMSTLSKRYDLSDVGLAKICKRMGVPRPGRGYWARVYGGRVPKKPSLPKLKKGQQQDVHLRNRSSIDIEPEALTEIERLVLLEKRKENRIEIPDQLLDPHKLVKITSRSLQGAKPNERHLVRPRAKGCLDIEIAKSSIGRAMRIMDSLIKALLSRGYEVRLSEDGETIQFIILGEPLGIRLEEKPQCQEHVLTPQEEKRIARDSWYRYQLPNYDYTPIGKLGLTIKGRRLWDQRVSWNDGKVQRIEHCLNAFIAGLIKSAGKIRTERLQEEKEEREREARRLRNEEIRRKQKIEQARLDHLMQQTQDWRKAQQIRAFIDEVMSRGQLKVGDEVLGSNEWIKWAQVQANRFDPTVESPSSILDEKIESDRYWMY